MFIHSLLLLAFSMSADAKIISKAIEYKDHDTVLEGFVAYDDAKTGKLPGVLVVHEWTGVGDYVKDRSIQLAKLGYYAFAADIYGKGIHPPAGKEAGELAGKYKGDRALMRSRIQAALDTLKKQPQADSSRIAAIGYCFGGTVALELARSGADIKGVASFHGGLSTPVKTEPGQLKAKIVVYHGAEDPNVPETEVKAFEEEMRAAKADWTLTKYANAVHAFTNPAVKGANAMKGSAEYNEAADRRSWASLQDYFREWFGR
jgi:dienelactone hydrolase